MQWTPQNLAQALNDGDAGAVLGFGGADADADPDVGAAAVVTEREYVWKGTVAALGRLGLCGCWV